MSAPRTKRQFAGAASDPAQRQITSYFYKGPDGARTSPDPAAAAISPELPAHVQSNLLNVGMRVRKSVPEGYKTGSSYSAFSLWADADADADAGSSPPSTAPTPTPAPAAGSALSSRRELLPFCGIHKVGGLAAQPAWSILSPSAPAAEDDLILLPVPALDDVPSLTSSQESAASTDDDHPVVPTISVTAAVAPGPANSNNRKRVFVSDEGEGEVPAPFSRPHGLGVWRDRAEWLDGEVSPRSLAPAGWENARVMAVARRRSSGKGVARAAAAAALPLEDLGQENMAVDDFGEAEFLDYRYGREMEVE